MKSLKEREKDAGIEYNRTFDEIAEELGMSRQAVINIAHNAIKKVRKELFKKGIDFKDLL